MLSSLIDQPVSSEPTTGCTSGLSGGKIAGIVVGTIIAVIIAFAGGFTSHSFMGTKPSTNGQQAITENPAWNAGPPMEEDGMDWLANNKASRGL